MASPPLNHSSFSPYLSYAQIDDPTPEEVSEKDAPQETPPEDMDPEDMFGNVTIRGIIRATGKLSLMETPTSEEASPADRTASCQRILDVLKLTPAKGTVPRLDIERASHQPATPLSGRLTPPLENPSSPSGLENSFEGFTTPLGNQPPRDLILEGQLETFCTILTSFMQTDDETLLQFSPEDRKELQKWIDLFLANFNSSTTYRRDYEALATQIQERLQQPAFENYFQV